MKIIKKILFLSSVVLLLTSSSCETNDIAKTNTRSFSCYIDGQLFVPKARTTITTSPLSEELVFNRGLNFYTRATDHKKFKIFFNIENYNEGLFKLKASNENAYDYKLTHAIIIAYAGSNNDKVYLSKDNSGTVTFTEVSDTNVAGVFEFTLYNKDDESDTISITNGKFNYYQKNE